MQQLLIMAGALLIGVGILTPDKKAPTLKPEPEPLPEPLEHEQNDPAPVIDSDSGQPDGNGAI